MSPHVAIVRSLVFVGAFRIAAAAAQACHPAVETPNNGEPTTVEFDKAWSGSPARYYAISRGDAVYVGYYDLDRWLTVGKLDLGTKQICTVRLGSQFAGWDAHNDVDLAFDSSGLLHVAANMHASVLVYGRAAKPDSLDGLRLRPMVGRDEGSVTYPHFVHLGNGGFFFLYRDGMSGNGAWLVNTFRDGAWSRLGQGAVFAAQWRGVPTNAYPSDPLADSRGIFHMAVMWRRSPDVSTNYALTYVQTRDFVHFTSLSGRSVATPIDPDSGDMVDDSGEKSGLLNNQLLQVDPNGRPIVIYHRYAPDGRNGIYIARGEPGGWKRVLIATSEKRTTYEGGGTLPQGPGFLKVQYSADDATASIDIRFPGEPSRRYALDPTTLEPVGPPGNVSGSGPKTPKLATPEGLFQPSQRNIPVACDQRNAPPTVSGFALLSYVAQRPNRDQKPNCDSTAPRACDPPPTDLVLSFPSNAQPDALCAAPTQK